ncbi:acid protease [Mycena filopes]|nr:acid protease [Mycena filopes]
MSNATQTISFQTNVVKAHQLMQRDCKRAEHFLAGHHPHGPAAFHARKHHKDSQPKPGDPAKSINVVDAAVTYLAQVGVGSPATTYQLLIDTGSSNTWFDACEQPFKPTSTCQDTRKKFSIKYGTGDCSGTEYTDRVTLGPGLVIENQSIGVADEATDMDGMGGILGIGPVDLTTGTCSGDCIPTVTDNLLKQGTISSECIGISYEPTTTNNAPNGYLSFGGPDESKYTGELNYVSLTKTSPACNYWGIDQSIKYGGKELMANCSGISDTGTTLCMLPSCVFQEYQKMTGAVLDQSTGLLTVSEEQYNAMDSMKFCIGGVRSLLPSRSFSSTHTRPQVEYELTKNAQIWPRCMNETLGAAKDKIYLIFADMGDIKIGDGLCFINGFTMLQRFYSVYDTTNSRVGFATTDHTMATTN